ncbi:MAG: motility associated factor glycosyltransferase family protein, partial [Nitrospinaceae bacterium]
MSNSVLNRNLASLKIKDPALFEKITPLKGSKFYATTKSKSGHPSLVHVDQDGRKKQIDSNYDPVGEAIRNLARFNISGSINFIVLGLGLGCQVSEIIKKNTKHAKILIFEKDPELFALAIREVDFTQIFEHPGVKLFVDTDLRDVSHLLEPERTNFTLNEYCLISQKALVEKNFEYYGVLYKEIEKYFKESRINLKTQSVHSKVYYKNIFSNQECLRSSPGIKNLKDCLSDIPAIICSAGPSLDKNIQLLKSSRKGFFLIAVATALKPLLHNGIQPDVVISIDPDELTIRSFDFFRDSGDTWLVYNAAVPNTIPKIFPTRKMAFDLDVHLAKWFNKHSDAKGSLGKTSSVAHSALNFAEFLACSPVILIGQDLSFQNQRLHCNQSFYFEDSINLVSRFNPLYYLNRLKYLNFGPNLTERIDIFGCQVGSTLAMDSYRQIFSSSLDTSKTVINATEGGVPIKGMKNLSLREPLHYHCRNSKK